MTNNILSIDGLSVAIGTEQGSFYPVDDVSFSIKQGQTFALLGESGCGKSMTALSIMRLLPNAAAFAAGQVRLREQALLSLSEKNMRQVRGGRIGMIFQDPMTSLNPVLTVGFQIRESVDLHTGLKGKAAKEKVLELLNAVGIPDPARRYTEYPHELSGGMKQRVMIAIALAGNPELLIADEPTTALDVTIQAQILELLQRIQQDNGMSILLITHDLGVVSKVADEVGVMYAGQMVEAADKATFFAQPQHPYSKKLFQSLPSTQKRGQRLQTIEGNVPSMHQGFTGCRFTERCSQAMAHCRQKVPNMTLLGDDKRVRCHLFDVALASDIKAETSSSAVSMPPSEAIKFDNEVLLSVDGLKVYFPIKKGLFKRTVGQVKAVDGISFEIKKGQTLAVVGESGCGKTTAGKCILKLNEASGGKVQFLGHDLQSMSEKNLRPLRADLQIIFQDAYASMNPRMSIQRVIEEGILSLKPEFDAAQRAARVDELLGKVGLSLDVKSRYPHELSGGQRQRVCIARALAVEPKLIVCDEPTSALDVSVQAQILNLLKDLQNELGLSYLFITHNLSVVEYLADEVAVMYLGRIVEYGDVKAVLTTPKHPYTQALISAIPEVKQGDKNNAGREIIQLTGELPSPANPPVGCHFHPRCQHAELRCRKSYPQKNDITEGHWTHCFLYEDR